MKSKDFNIEHTVEVTDSFKSFVLSSESRGKLAERLVNDFLDNKYEVVENGRSMFLKVDNKLCKCIILNDDINTLNDNNRKKQIIKSLVHTSKLRPGPGQDLSKKNKIKNGDLFIISFFNSKSNVLNISEILSRNLLIDMFGFDK